MLVTLRGEARREGSTKGTSLRTAAFLGGIRDGAEEVKASTVRWTRRRKPIKRWRRAFYSKHRRPDLRDERCPAGGFFGGSKGFPAFEAHSASNVRWSSPRVARKRALGPSRVHCGSPHYVKRGRRKSTDFLRRRLILLNGCAQATLTRAAGDGDVVWRAMRLGRSTIAVVLADRRRWQKPRTSAPSGSCAKTAPAEGTRAQDQPRR